jgi:glucuronosyltransferase
MCEILSYRYHENAKRTSRLLADQPFSPADKIRYWVDYVIRHDGAKHLRSESSLRLSWYQYWSLDVVAFLLGTIVTSFYVVYRMLLLVGRIAWKMAARASLKWKTD